MGPVAAPENVDGIVEAPLVEPVTVEVAAEEPLPVEGRGVSVLLEDRGQERVGPIQQ